MSKCVFNKSDLNLELKDKVRDILEDLWDETDPNNQKALYINSLKDIGEGYDITSLPALADTIDEIIREFTPELYDVLPTNITTYLSGNSSNIETITEENPTKLDALDNPDEVAEAKQRTRGFIVTNYGTATEVAAVMESDVVDNIVKCFLVNRTSGKVIKTEHEINEQLRNYQEELLQNVTSYLKDMYSKLPSKRKDAANALKTLTDLTMYKDGDYIGALNVLNKLGNVYLHHSHFTADDLRNAFILKRADKRKFIKAYNSLVILNHFDDLLSDKLGNILKINGNYQGTFTGEDKYSIAGTGAHNYRSWSDKEKDVNINEQVSDVNRLLIETTPMYSWGNSSPIGDKKVRLDAFNYIISKIKGLANNPDSHSVVFDDMFFITYPEFEDIRKDIQGKTLYELISVSNDQNIMQNFSSIFKLLSNDKFFGNHQSDVLKSFKSIEKNLIYSLKQGIFGDSSSSLYGIYKSDPSSTNYYSYICQLASTANPLDFIQYRIDEDGNIVRATLKDNLNSQLRRQLEERIAASLSVLSETYYDNKIAKYKPTFEESLDNKLKNSSVFKFIIPDANLEVHFTPKAKRSNAFNIFRDGKPLSYFNNEEDWNNLLNFFKDFLKEDFSPNSPLVDNYLTLKQKNGNIQYETAISDLLQFSTSVFFNSYFSHKIVSKNATLQEFKSRQESVFGQDNITSIYKSSPEVGILEADYIPVLDDITSAYGMTTDAYTSGIVKDGNGNNLSGVGMSMLGTNYRTQWVKQCQRENSATKQFSLLTNPRLYKGMVVSREFKGRNENKKHIDFNTPELFYTAFVSNYLCNIVGTVNAAFLPSVISDKSQSMHSLVDLNQLNEFGKSYAKLTREETIEIINKELGQCYNHIMDSVLSSWDALNKFAATINPSLVGNSDTIPMFNPLTNFAEANALYGKDTRKVLESLLKVYQQTTGDNNLEIKDELSFIGNKELSFNRTLISLTNRFTPGYFSSRGLNPEDTFGKLTNSEDFWKIKEFELITDLLDNNFSIETVDERGNNITTPEVAYLAKNKSWLQPGTNRVTLAKFTGFGKTFKISKWSDFSQIGEYTENGIIYNWNTPGFKLSKFIELRGGDLEIHPDLRKFNVLDYLFTQENILTTVGTHANHPAKKAAQNPNDLVEEAARYVAQHKRNVSYTAAKQVMIQGLINGILPQYKVAVIQDEVAPTFNPMGDHDSGGVKIYDGSTFVSPETVYLENNSLGGAKVGLDKKPFVHFYKEDTASGGIIKTAGFALTNFTINNSKFNQRMVRKMWSNTWTNQFGLPSNFNILQDFNGNQIQYEDVYYKGSDGKFYMLNSITSNTDGTYSLIKSQVEPDGTIIKQMPIEITPKEGTFTGSSSITLIPVNTNYGLYQMFGGYKSYSMSDEGLIPSEASIRNVVKAVNSVGVKLSDNVLSQNDVYQPLKHSSIQYVVTAGAIKQGAANVNLKSSYYNEDPYLTMNFKTNDIGIQLDAEHTADESTLSIMTQVVNALSSRGYTTELAQEVYDAMFALTESGIDDYVKGFDEYINVNDSTKFKNAIVSTIVKSIQNSTSKDGNLMQAIMDDLIAATKSGKLITYKNTEGKIPFSDPSIFNNLCSTLSSTLTKIAIRLKFNGSLAVLNPSHGIWKLFGDRLYGSFNSDVEIQNLQKLYNSKPITDFSQIKLGRAYDIATEDGLVQSELVNTPQQYWHLRDVLSTLNNPVLIERVSATNAVEWNGAEYVPIGFEGGRDLASYNFTFKDMGGNSYNMWDLDVIKNLYNNPDVNNKILLRRQLQEELAAISTGKTNTVQINGNTITVDKESLEVSPYELIMPKVYASRFGLKSGDSLSLIKNDDTFFFKRMLSNWESKVSDSDFDIELKRLDGKHVYLIDSRFYKNSSLSPVEIESRWDGEKLYRVNHNGDKLHRLASDTDKIFKDANGNEIIVTSNTGYYIDSFNYHTLRVSNSAAKSNNINEIIQPILSSDSKEAKKFSKYLGKNDPTDIVTYINQLYKDSIEKLKANPRAQISDPRIDAIRESASEIHTSFIKSLDVLAARIPAQSMQSFMPMRVVGFDETDKNSAYVNYFQFWLQGSDLDIDKVSLLGYSFNKTGKYVGWSPYFNLYSKNTLKESENLPFPTGKELELVETDDKSLLNWGNDFVGSKKLFNFNGSNVIFLPEYDTDNNLHSLESLSTFLRMVRSADNKLYIPRGSKLPFSEIVNIVNKHNLYAKSARNSEDMIKNFISSYMFKVSNTPINLIQSQSSIDDAVFLLKKIASQSAEGKRNLQYTPGNVVNKYESMYDFQSGKKNVGIVASAIKVYDGLTQYYNTTLRSGNNTKQTDLLFNRQICGNSFKLLANAYTNDLGTVLNEEVTKALLGVNNDVDAKLVFSALMTAATDNAKDPILAKINAGPNMMGLYTYGTAIGIPLYDLAGVIMSRTARILSTLMDSNIFNHTNGMSITQAIKYLDEGPDAGNLDPEFFGLLQKEFHSDGSDFVIGKILRYRLSDSNTGHDLINNLRKSAKNLSDRVNKTTIYRFIEELSNYMRYINVVDNDNLISSNGTNYKALDSIKQLVQGASEMGRLRGIYALNQGLPNKVEDKFKFIDRFETIFEDRIKEIPKEEWNTLVYTNGQIMTIGDVISRLKMLVYNPTDSYRISFDKFMTDKAYRNSLIALYGGLKHSFNVLDAAWSISHYRGYMETFHMDMESNYMMMSKYRMMRDLGPRVIKDGGFFKSVDKANVYKKLQSFCDATLRNTWMKSSEKTIMIPKGVTIINNVGNKFVTQNDTPILLGTQWGNESFKMWMDSSVIPALQEFEPNEFIQALSPIRFNRTLSGNASLVYTLPTNMLPRSPSEMDVLNKYKRAFNKLQGSAPYNGYPITDLFFYYNLINFNGAVGQSALTTIFEDIVRTKSSPLMEEFHEFISLLDSNSQLVEGVDYTFDAALKWCAPIGDTNTLNTFYVRDYNTDDMKYHLYKRKSKYTGEEEFEGFDEFDQMGEDYNETPNYGPNTQDYGVVLENQEYSNPWNIEDIHNNTQVRISHDSVITFDADQKLKSVNFRGKEYGKEEILKIIKDLGGTDSDLDVPFVTRVVNGISIRAVDSVQYTSIINHILDNPC